MADNLASARYVEQNFAVGDKIAMDGVSGVVEAITATSIALRTADGGRAVVCAQQRIGPHHRGARALRESVGLSGPSWR